jgi:hypothetical protein
MGRRNLPIYIRGALCRDHNLTRRHETRWLCDLSSAGMCEDFDPQVHHPTQTFAGMGANFYFNLWVTRPDTKFGSFFFVQKNIKIQ